MASRSRTAAAALAAAALVLPDRLGLDGRYPGVLHAAFRPHTALAALVGALLAARRRPGLAVALGGIAMAGAAPLRDRVTARPAGSGGVAVLSANVWRSTADVAALGSIVAHERPDFVVLPEADGAYLEALTPHVPGYRGWASVRAATRHTSGVTLLVADAAGEVKVTIEDTMRSRPIHVTGGVLGERTLHATHTTSPTTVSRATDWRADLEVIGRWCRGPVAPIVAGDLNATFDHAAMRAAAGQCRSAAAAVGAGLVGTFPAQLPRWAGIQIDHVLVPPDAQVSRCVVLDVPGSDHRAVLATFSC